MAISVNWPTKIITVPKADTALVQTSPVEIRSLDLNVFRLALKSLEDDPEGMPFPITHRHNTEVTVGGLTLARVVEIINDYTVTFEDGQYAVNLYGANSNVGDRVNVNQVSIRTANSAGLITSAAIEQGEYSGSQGAGVWIDTVSGTDGTIYPVGTQRQPCKSLDNVTIILGARGLGDQVYFVGDLDITASSNVAGYTFVGESHVSVNIDFAALATTSDVKVINSKVTGTIGTNFHAEESIIDGVQELNGHIHHSSIKGNIILGNNLPTYIFDCSSVDQDDPPTINMGGTGQSLSMPNYSGLITISNMSDVTQEVGIGLNSGMVIIDAGVTGANAFVVSGVGSLVDNGSVTVNSDGLMNKANIADSVSDKVSNLQQLIESTQYLPAFGNIYFLDPINGNDSNSGATKALAVKTFSAAQTLTTSGNQDIIFIINTSGADLVIDEQWTITKAHLSVRATGYGSFTLLPTATAGATIDIQADSFSLHNIKVQTSATDGLGGDQYCIEMQDGVDNCHFKGLKIARGIEGGIYMHNCDGSLIQDCIIEHFTGKVGIDIYGDSHENVILDNFIYDMTTGIRFNDTAGENWIKNRNLLHDMGTGIRVEDITCGHLYVDRSSAFENMGTPLSDAGGSGINLLRVNDNADIASAVWEEGTAGHTTVGSTGKKLNDIPDEQVFSI